MIQFALALILAFFISTPQAHAGEGDVYPTVLLCGAGPAPYYENMTDALADALKDGKVKLKISDGNSRRTCLEKTKEANAVSLLYVVANVSQRSASDTILTVQCISADGNKLWEEEQSGPFISMSVQSTVNSVSEKMVRKVQAHIGKDGLPVSN